MVQQALAGVPWRVSWVSSRRTVTGGAAIAGVT
ncbi:Hypothetical protein KLENKIAIHU_824 [Klenkia terrae]|jgi:hypothetical protein|nr:Hypothetical protein KLENKIAIHU_824 [Klenkia terrae]